MMHKFIYLTFYTYLALLAILRFVLAIDLPIHLYFLFAFLLGVYIGSWINPCAGARRKPQPDIDN